MWGRYSILLRARFIIIWTLKTKVQAVLWGFKDVCVVVCMLIVRVPVHIQLTCKGFSAPQLGYIEGECGELFGFLSIAVGECLVPV